jgi:hypothetical protein
MATVTISCLAIGITGTMLGACVGFLAFALLNAGKRADEWPPPSLPTVEKILAWARIEGDLDLVEAAVGEYENAFAREMILSGERRQNGATWVIPAYSWVDR